MTYLDDILGRLKAVKRSRSGWTARCPAHEDRRPSLSVREGDEGRILLHCFAGCTVEAIVAALGLELSDLFPDTRATLGDSRATVQRWSSRPHPSTNSGVAGASGT